MAISPFKNLIFLMQKHLSSSSLLKSTSFTADYLVNSCGLTRQSAIAASQKLRLNEKNIQGCDSVLHLLKSHGFENTHVAKMIEKFPILLTKYKADEILKPKLDYLVQNGFAGSRLHDLIGSNPVILGRSLSCRIKPSLEFLKSFLGTEERVRLAAKRNSRLFTNDLKRTLQPNIELFVKEGVPRDAIAHFFMTQPAYMQSSAERMADGLKTFKDQFGISVDPVASSKIFLKGVSTIASIGVSAWKTRVQLLKSLLGCSQDDVLSIFRRYPSCFGLSEETLWFKVDFYFNTLQLKPEVIINHPKLLGMSLHKRIRPRYNVSKLLLSNELLLSEDISLSRLFTISEEKFLGQYVTLHLEQLPSLLETYTNDKMINKTGISP